MCYPGVGGIGGLAGLDREQQISVRAAARLMTQPPKHRQAVAKTFDPAADAAARRRWGRNEESTPDGVAWLFGD